MHAETIESMRIKAFQGNEELYRAVRPWPRFIKADGSITTAAFKAKNGLSVTRQFCGTRSDGILRFKKDGFEGKVYMLTCNNCEMAKAVVKQKPSTNNLLHCEIHGGADIVELSNVQCIELARSGSFICDDIQIYVP